jgi:hypothetical protein
MTASTLKTRLLKVGAAAAIALILLPTAAATQQLKFDPGVQGVQPLPLPSPSVGATPIEIPHIQATPSVGATPIEIPRVEGGTVICVNGTVRGQECVCPRGWSLTAYTGKPPTARCIPPTQ